MKRTFWVEVAFYTQRQIQPIERLAAGDRQHVCDAGILGFRECFETFIKLVVYLASSPGAPIFSTAREKREGAW